MISFHSLFLALCLLSLYLYNSTFKFYESGIKFYEKAFDGFETGVFRTTSNGYEIKLDGKQAAAIIINLMDYLQNNLDKVFDAYADLLYDITVAMALPGEDLAMTKQEIAQLKEELKNLSSAEKAELKASISYMKELLSIYVGELNKTNLLSGIT